MGSSKFGVRNSAFKGKGLGVRFDPKGKMFRGKGLGVGFDPKGKMIRGKGPGKHLPRVFRKLCQSNLLNSMILLLK